LTGEEDEIKVQIRYKDVEEKFSGRVDDVWIAINRFFSEFIPAFKISQGLVLTVNLQKLIRDCENIIAFTQEGPHLLVSRDKLTDNETLALQLLAGHVGYKLGMLESDSISKEELQARLGKTAKITSTRLGELVKSEMVTKTSDGKYGITTFGIVQMQNDFLPRIKAKTDV
jgi:hypothetical protein